ncbi:MAG: hypothetical protein ACOCQY_02700 [Halorhabdus sp.]
MRFRSVVIAAVILVLATVAGLAAYQISDAARGEAAQTTIETNDSLAVEPDLRQHLAPEDDHDPTAYGENGTEVVEYNGTVWEPEGNYTYYPNEGEIEFERDEASEANITYEYDIPEDQVADEQLQTLTQAQGQVIRVGVGLSFVVLFLFIAGFTARKIGVGGRPPTGR